MPTSILALHTWTLDTTPLAEVLAVARVTGWDAVELRHADFVRATEAGERAEDVIARVRATGLPVACVGARPGWMFATGEERERLFGILAEACRRAVALGCPRVMSPVDFTAGDLRRAAARVREAGEIAAAHGVRLALEPQSQAPQFRTLQSVRELLAAADPPGCGLLVDAYHVQRSGDLPALATLEPGEVAYVQYSDVPAETRPGETRDRLPPGQGIVPFRQFFAAVARCGYSGPLSYEAPNPAAWARDPAEVAREALRATRALLDG